jgi:transposase
MFDTDLYQQVLGLNVSCNVTDVELEAESTEIHVHVGYTEYCCRNCLQCSGELACYDHAPERLWRHRNICHFHTLVHARVSRAECLEHGVLQVEVPWAEPHGRFTLLMERFVIDVIQACQTVKGACALVGISWDQAWPVLDRAVARRLACKQATAITPIDLDENAFRKGHRYLTFVNDVDRGTVEFVAKGQEKVSLAAFYESCTTTQFANIDNRDGHVGTLYHSTLEAVPLALSEFVFDRVPVMQHMNETVDVVRRHESRLLIAEDNDCLKRKSSSGSLPTSMPTRNVGAGSGSSEEAVSRLHVPAPLRRTCDAFGRPAWRVGLVCSSFSGAVGRCGNDWSRSRRWPA